MARGVAFQELTGARAIECESDWELAFALRTEDESGTDTGPLSLALYDPATGGGGFACELRSAPGGTLLATATVSMRGARASGTLTVTSTNASDADVVVVGARTFTLKTTPAAEDDVAIGADSEATLANLVAAINGTGEDPPVYTGTEAHTEVEASQPTTLTMQVDAKTGGTGANGLATTTDWASASWGATTLEGGTGRAGFLVHFDGEDLPSTLVASGTQRRAAYDVFGLEADGSPVKLVTGPAALMASATEP